MTVFISLSLSLSLSLPMLSLCVLPPFGAVVGKQRGLPCARFVFALEHLAHFLHVVNNNTVGNSVVGRLFLVWSLRGSFGSSLVDWSGWWWSSSSSCCCCRSCCPTWPIVTGLVWSGGGCLIADRYLISPEIANLKQFLSTTSDFFM